MSSINEKQNNIPPHICRDNLGRRCICTICGTICHTLENDCKGFGTGRIDVWCTVCGATESFYDDTGSTIESNLFPEGYVYREYKEWTKRDFDKVLGD